MEVKVNECKKKCLNRSTTQTHLNYIKQLILYKLIIRFSDSIINKDCTGVRSSNLVQ